MLRFLVYKGFSKGLNCIPKQKYSLLHSRFKDKTSSFTLRWWLLSLICNRINFHGGLRHNEIFSSQSHTKSLRKKKQKEKQQKFVRENWINCFTLQDKKCVFSRTRRERDFWQYTHLISFKETFFSLKFTLLSSVSTVGD